MKKVIIISYHYPPMDVIASYRALAYAKHLYKFGVYPTIITHRWEEFNGKWLFHTENDEVLEEEYETHKVIRVPRRPVFKKKSSGLFNKIDLLWQWYRGFLDSYSDSFVSFVDLKKAAIQEVKNGGYSMMIGVFSPHHHLKMCYEISNETGLPYALDFRDLWDNRIIRSSYNPSIKETVQDYFFSKHWRKWINSSSFYTITSKPWADKLFSITGKKGDVIKNGYDPNDFGKIEGFVKGEVFEITHIGTLYQHQHIDVFLKGVALFIERNKPNNFKLRFVGALRSSNNPPNTGNGYLQGVESLFSSILPPEYYELTRRKPKVEAIKDLERANMLFFPSFPDAPGTYSGKIFDFLGAKREILSVPSDHGVIDELLSRTQSGIVVNNSLEVASIIEKRYFSWIENGSDIFKSNDQMVNEYTRESQVKKMAELIFDNGFARV